jgi:hypothetical protein
MITPLIIFLFVLGGIISLSGFLSIVIEISFLSIITIRSIIRLVGLLILVITFNMEKSNTSTTLGGGRYRYN